MNLILSRNKFRSDGIFGYLTDMKGKFLFVTLEHAFAHEDPETKSVSYLPIVPIGVYKCVRYLSPKHGYDVFLLEGVKDHDYIEIHIGNWNIDSDGCILVGNQVGNRMIVGGGGMIMDSGNAFKAFMKLQEGIDAFYLTVE